MLCPGAPGQSRASSPTLICWPPTSHTPGVFVDARNGLTEDHLTQVRN